MILRITAQDPRSREKKDIEVVASPDDSVGALLSSLPLDLGGRRCFVGATPLDPGEKLASSPLLPGTALSVGGPGPDYHLVRGAAAGTAHVLAGPDAGFGVALRPGRHTLGRIPGSAVRLNDEGVSRTHAAIEAHPGGAAVISDAGSSNGTLVNGTLITAPATLPSGSLIQVGASLLRWIAASPTPLRVAQTADGHLEFDRVFAPVPAIPQAEIDLPAQQAPGRGAATMVLSVIGGLASGIILAAAMRQWDLLLVSALGPLAPFGVYAVEGRQRKQRKATLARAKEDATAQIAALAAQEDQARRLLAPGQAEIVAMATGMRPDLWPRDGRSPHGLLLRVGVADRPPSVQVHGQPWDGFQMPVLAGVPVTVDLRETGVLGVIGSGERARGLLRWLLVQLATLRSPDDLRLVLLTPDSGTHMGWARWLPHLDPGNAAPVPCWIGNTEASRAARIKELGQLIKDRMAAASDRGEPAARSGGEVVVVLDGALALRKLTGIRDILRLGPEAGVYVLCADTQGMTECRGLCELTADGIRLIRSPNEPVVTASPETMEPVLAEQVARALAPMRDRMSGTDVQAAIPYPVRLLDRLGLGTPTAEDVLGLWRRKRRGPSTRIVLGADAAGQVTVDLAGQGPHTMLGGATGAGKSILLQTLVTALLLANQPDELNLVLVDFKGGSAFLPFQHCPHVTALIRSTGETAADSFTEADADRMLASVRAEVRRRESVLARHGGEIDHYWQARAAQPGLPPLPRLVMIFDEFARVLDTSPNFLKELVNVAGKGRSLGMHLVLATQSLQGKLSPELKNNISLRISLRQNEPADSVEVLGAPDAATIPGTLRGRGMILCTTDESRTPRVFQSGYLGDPPPGSVSQLSVRVLGWADLGAERPAPVTSGGGDATDQELAIAAVVEAARGAGMAAPFRALLPPLPASLPLEQLTGYQTSPPPGMAIPFGLTDVPDEQAQPPCFLDLAATGRLMVAGGPQSGRTTFARALITSLATRFSPGQAHFYVVEHQPAGLAEYASLPHCGGVFSPARPDRIRRLVEWLAQETQRRASARFDSGSPKDPFIVVIVDGWEQFESRADPTLADVSLGPALRDVIAAGPPLGVHVIPMGGQDLLAGKVPALCSQRLLLPFPNAETLRLQLRSGMASPPLIPGRAIDAATGRHLQVCQPGMTGAELVASVAARPDASSLDPRRMPRRFPPLPGKIEVGDLPLPQPLPSPSWIPVGVGGPEVTTVGIDLFDAGPHLMLISGPDHSGRTTAIATLARLLSWNGIDVLAVAPPRSPLSAMLEHDDGIHVLTAATIEDSALRAAVEPFGERRYAVLLDDADRITVQAAKQGFSDSPTLLEEIAHPAQLGRRALILAGDVTPILSGHRRSLSKVTSEILMSGARLLLSPAKRSDARELSMLLEPDQYFTRPAGRGYLATTGAPALIQLAVAR